MTGEEKTTKKIPNKKITSRMKKIINWEFIQKASDDAESKIKAWKEEILEKNIKEIENHIEAKIENDMVDFENLELSKEIKRKKKNLEKIEKEKKLEKNLEQEKEEISENIDENLENKNISEENLENNDEEKNFSKNKNSKKSKKKNSSKEKILEENIKSENISENNVNTENNQKTEFLENIFEEEKDSKIEEKNLENQESEKIEEKSSKNFLNIDENFDKEEEKSVLEFEKKFEEEKNLKNNSENEKKSEEISEKEKQEELRKKLFEEYDIEIIKSDKEEEKTWKIDFKKLFLHIFVLTIILSWVYIVYENKENFINFFTRTWEEKPVIEQEIEKKVDEKVENKMITIEKTDFEIQIVTKEKWKIYKFEWVEYKNFTELKKHLNDLIKQQEKIDSENKVKQRIRAEFFR